MPIDDIVAVQITSPEGIEVVNVGAGISGFSGRSGYSGFSGRSGYSGYSSKSGYSGYSSLSGYSGYSSKSGYSGYSSKSGYSGYSGFSGLSGYSGFSAASPGASGYSGFSGAGTSGYSGYSGYSSASGYSGYSAASPGASGYSGYSGKSGYSGFSSTSGYSGFSGSGGGGGTTSQVTGSDFTTTSTSFIDVTGLTFAASANKVYEVDVFLVTQSTTANGIYAGIGYSAAGAVASTVAIGQSTGNTGLVDGGPMAGAGIAIGPFGNEASLYKVIWYKTVVITGANAGNITAQVAANASGTVTVYIGSRMTVTLLA